MRQLRRNHQSSQREGSPFQERIVKNNTIIPKRSPKPSSGCWLSTRNNGDIPRFVAHQTASTNHPSQVIASLAPKKGLGPYQYRFMRTSVRAPPRQPQHDQRNGVQKMSRFAARAGIGLAGRRFVSIGAGQIVGAWEAKHGRFVAIPLTPIPK